MPWGVIGPDAITYYAQHYQIAHFAQSIDVFLSHPSSLYWASIKFSFIYQRYYHA